MEGACFREVGIAYWLEVQVLERDTSSGTPALFSPAPGPNFSSVNPGGRGGW